MQNNIVRVKKLNAAAIIPTRGSQAAAGADLYALPGEDITVAPGQTVLVHTGIAMEIPDGWVGLVHARSGLATKSGLAPANKVGVIDSDYRGEVMVGLHNHSQETRTVAGGERIAQMVITPYLPAVFEESEELSDTARGEGGFGSTGRM